VGLGAQAFNISLPASAHPFAIWNLDLLANRCGADCICNESHSCAIPTRAELHLANQDCVDVVVTHDRTRESVTESHGRRDSFKALSLLLRQATLPAMKSIKPGHPMPAHMVENEAAVATLSRVPPNSTAAKRFATYVPGDIPGWNANRLYVQRVIASRTTVRQESRRIYSSFKRRMEDLAWKDSSRIEVRLRPFCCNTEDLRAFRTQYSSTRSALANLSASLGQITLALGGSAGSRLAQQLGILASSSTLFRQLHLT
jgi:hypothetical protein